MLRADCIQIHFSAKSVCYTKIMGTLYSDTDPNIEELQIRLLRQAPAWRKLEMMAELNATARNLAYNGLKQRYPKADQAELDYHLATLLYGEELAKKIFM